MRCVTPLWMTPLDCVLKGQPLLLKPERSLQSHQRVITLHGSRKYIVRLLKGQQDKIGRHL